MKHVNIIEDIGKGIRTEELAQKKEGDKDERESRRDGASERENEENRK